MAYTTFPNSAVVYILADIPGDGEFQATGVVIGPHTILTAAHELWDADVGRGADAVSLYPGYQPSGSDYNPSGALGGTQAIHYIKVPDQNGELDARGTEHDFAVIDTSANLTPYGHFALNYGFRSGDAILLGYPASANGNQTGTGGVVSADPYFSDLDVQGIAISPGNSGGPFYDQISNGRGGTVDAVTGLVSTDDFATKINRKKVGIIKNWVASDSALWTGQGSPAGSVVPQIAGTTDSATLAASLAAAPSTTGLGVASAAIGDHADAGEFATMVNVLHETRTAGAQTSLASASPQPPSWLEAQYGWLDPHQHHHYAATTKA